MSKIGKKPIAIPSGVEVSYADHVVTAKGPRGSMSHTVPDFLSVNIADGKVTVMPATDGVHDELAARWGLERALIRNILTGVSTGFQESLELQGVGYKATVKPARPDARLNDTVGQESGRSGGGNTLELSVGFSHPVSRTAPEGITFSVEKNVITVSGIDRELVGRVAADIRAIKPPEPYKGSGVRYVGEVIKLKAGKKAVAAGT